jgi:hypothetical protein
MMFASRFKSNHHHHNSLLLPKENLTYGSEKKERAHSPKGNKSAPITHLCGDNVTTVITCIAAMGRSLDSNRAFSRSAASARAALL